MKFVSLVVVAVMFSMGAFAQTTPAAAKKRTATNTQQTAKERKAKPSETKARAAKHDEVTRLTDEKAHKAKWTFEQMLQRRLEIDAEEGERKSQHQE